ncbi:tetratricopeptide repeat protein [Weeksellaceae bacterium A-14]
MKNEVKKMVAVAKIMVGGVVSVQAQITDSAVAKETVTNPSIEAFKKKIEANPNDTDSLVKLATAYQDAQSWDAAAATWDKLIALVPDWAPAYYSKAYVYQSAKNNDAAKKGYEQYIAKVKPEEIESSKPNLAYAYFFVAYMEQKDNPAKAKEYVAKSLEYNPGNQEAQNLSQFLNS